MLTEQIKASREAKKMKKQILAKTVGMTRFRYSRFENGEAPVTLNELERIFNELDLVIGPAKSLTLDQTIINKIKELNELV